MAKGEKVEIRMTTEEKAELYGRADELDMKPTDYVRMLLFPSEVDAPVVQVKAAVAPVKPKGDGRANVGGYVGKSGRDYTGETISKFGRVMREYRDDDGALRWE
jgi:hypothetical protein